MARRSTRISRGPSATSVTPSEPSSPEPRRSSRRRSTKYQIVEAASSDSDSSDSDDIQSQSQEEVDHRPQRSQPRRSARNPRKTPTPVVDISSEEEDEEDADDESMEVEEDDQADDQDSMVVSTRPNYLLDDLQDKSKRHEAITRFKYLLGISDLLVHFIERRAEKDRFTRSVLEVAKQKTASRRRKNSGSRHSRPLSDEEPEETQDIFTESPPWLEGTLRDYQIEGLNWLISLYHNCISGILADEMGLGKTLQTISFLSYLKHVKGIDGPHLILVPKSTVNNWAREIQRFAPSFNVLVIGGDKYERAELIQDRLLPCKFDICVTSFELVIKEKNDLKRFQWQYLIVDEAHRIKNEDSMLSKIVRALFSHNRLLITGTPLQNNLHELWALLNFILPDVFSDSELFDEWFRTDNREQEEEDDEEEEDDDIAPSSQANEDEDVEMKSDTPVKEEVTSQRDTEVIEQLHKLLRPFLLRRVKSDVETSLLPKKEVNLYVGLTDMQIQWYRQLLVRDIDTVNATNQRDAQTKKLLNVVMQLRKCCNHPYLFEGAEPGPPYSTGEHIVQNAAKMIVLDKLLGKLRSQGSRVLIFSQMTHMLDILEDYCALREYEYCRIDGSTIHDDRVAAIDEFNKPGSSKFLFLLTTRAGGLGINLTTADQVVIYDSDWNPQADLQAMDRAHRIGQTKQVYVYRFVTENAIEEKVLEKAARKLRLDQLVIQQARKGENVNGAKDKKDKSSKEELVNMIRHGAQEVFDETKSFSKDVSIDDILERGQARTSELNDRYAEYGLDEIQKKFTFKFDHAPVVSVPEKELEKETPQDDYKYPQMRRARIDYGLDKDRRAVKAPRLVPLNDFQFFPSEIEDIQEKEMQYYRKQLGVKITQEDMSDEDEESIAQMNVDIENAVPLSEEEKEYKDKLVAKGFPNFSKRDFHHFIHLMVVHGKHNIDEIVADWKEKSEQEIRRYHSTFLARYKEIADYQRYMAQVDAGERKARTQLRQAELLSRKCSEYKAPLSEMQIHYPVSNVKKSYTEDEDRYLLVKLNEFGYDAAGVYEKIRDSIRTSGLFDFDWYFLSRTPTELGRRCNTLLLLVTREYEGPNALKRKTRKTVETDEDGSPMKRSRDDTTVPMSVIGLDDNSRASTPQ